MPNEAPHRRGAALRPALGGRRRNPAAAEDVLGLPAPADLGGALLAVLASPSVANKRWIYRQYDSTVRTEHHGRAPAATPRWCGSRARASALAMATDGNGRYCWLDPYEGARLAVAEACRNVAACAERYPSAPPTA